MNFGGDGGLVGKSGSPKDRFGATSAVLFRHEYLAPEFVLIFRGIRLQKNEVHLL